MEDSLICNIQSDEMPSSHPELLRTALAEFISMVIFVFAGEGSTVALCKLSEGNVGTPAALVATALARGFAFFVAVSAAANISGGHVNPAVTLGAYLGGNINLIRLLYYWAAQMLGSVVACFLLAVSTAGLKAAAFSLSSDISIGGALVMEMVMTYGLVHTFYATTIDPNKGNIGVIAPLAIGFMVGANTLAGGTYDGASLNPAVSFGPALVSWTWTHQWVYWIGPLIGGGAAGLIYDNFLQGDPPNEPLPSAI